MAETISRRSFLKKVGLAALSVGFLSRGNILTAHAAVADNLGGGGGGLHIDNRPPANTKKGWICTDANYGQGVLYYYNGSKWVPAKGTWTE